MGIHYFIILNILSIPVILAVLFIASWLNVSQDLYSILNYEIKFYIIILIAAIVTVTLFLNFKNFLPAIICLLAAAAFGIYINIWANKMLLSGIVDLKNPSCWLQKWTIKICIYDQFLLNAAVIGACIFYAIRNNLYFNIGIK